MGTRRAAAGATERRLADAERHVQQIRRFDATGDDVAAVATVREVDPSLFADRLDGLAREKRHLAGVVRGVVALAGEVPVADDSPRFAVDTLA